MHAARTSKPSPSPSPTPRHSESSIAVPSEYEYDYCLQLEVPPTSQAFPMAMAKAIHNGRRALFFAPSSLLNPGPTLRSPPLPSGCALTIFLERLLQPHRLRAFSDLHPPTPTLQARRRMGAFRAARLPTISSLSRGDHDITSCHCHCHCHTVCNRLFFLAVEHFSLHHLVPPKTG